MDFELSDDQQALRAAARDLLAARSSPALVRAAMAAEAPYDASLWAAMVDQGWLGVDTPEADGGLGLGMVEVAILAEEVGRHTAPAPFVESLLALGSLRDAGESDWVARLVSGDAVGCVAASSRALAIYGPAADVAVIAADDGRLYAAELAGKRPSAEPAMDQTRRLGWLTLDAALGARPIGDRQAAERLMDRAAVCYSATLLGAASRVLELATQYAKDRVQFGRPIGSFQAVKHRCADMLVDVEGMRSVAYHAAWCLGAGDPDASIAASTAKVWCADAAKRVMASGLQVHGGIGFTWEHDLHLFLKRAQLDQLAWGDATFHRARLAGFLHKKVKSGQPVL